MSLIVVQYFYDLPALSLAKRQLEAAGIETVTRDELTLQVYSIEARATGGAKLLVHKKDYAKASQILIEGGFITANENPKDFWIVDFLDTLSRPIPGVKQLPKELRIVIVCFILIAIPFGLALLMSI
ncbi:MULTISPECIES: putative signal transducing protein [unclassified Aureispira]|uniref:putative signal transducing protein n=1 Tax=unclassified Aureispira TaxID=2649989 RepID=UPI0006961A10|nr:MULTISPECIES: DUF2007 domain-containing protein [unclassified Aureispira]WMX14445.1 DUF2007 domain-containing protein [Aureispira sp. CCB-E]